VNLPLNTIEPREKESLLNPKTIQSSSKENFGKPPSGTENHESSRSTNQSTPEIERQKNSGSQESENVSLNFDFQPGSTFTIIYIQLISC